MPSEPSAPLGESRPSDADRDRLAAELGEHYAAGRLELRDLDARLQLVLTAESIAAAARALDGLGPLAETKMRRGGSRRRHAQHDRPQSGWVPTLERFRDPGSGTLVRVWIDPVDRSRKYVLDGPG